MNLQGIGEKFKNLRENANFTQKNIASFLDIDQSLISKFESGERSLQIELIEKYACLLGTTLNNIVDGIPTFGGAKISFRANILSSDDLAAIHDINRIALNCFFMTRTLEESNIE